MMTSLSQHSIDLILAHQAPSGAYVASPSFSTYAYSWLRDGSFIAHAMDRVGRHESARRFHVWAGGVIERYVVKIERLIARQAGGQPIALGDQMHTRFTIDGLESDAEWTNFQLDGYGTWLWALVDHLRRADDRALYKALRPQAALVARYLQAFWQAPCYDCWEEFGDKVHISTLAAIYGGLRALGDYDPSIEAGAAAADIRRFVLERGVTGGHLVKFLGSTAVDASLIGAAVPYGLLAPDDPIMVATIARIERDLRRGGVCRYLADTYYGGGAWVLLAAWLGWHYAEAGDAARAAELREWVAAQADAAGNLPEQVGGALLAPDSFQPWVERWGPVATPLLWSHAMYLILEGSLHPQERGRGFRGGPTAP